MINLKPALVLVLLALSSLGWAQPEPHHKPHHKSHHKPELKVEAPWVRMVPPVSANTAGYFRLCNGDTENALVGAASPVARVVEIHTVEEVDGASGMRPLKSVAMAPASCTFFAPGGKHLMFIGLHKPLQEDQTVSVTLTFKNGESLTVPFAVKKGATEEKAHSHSHHHHH